nr:muscleblind-like protein 1 isoform X7 [Aedes albopictus]
MVAPARVAAAPITTTTAIITPATPPVTPPPTIIITTTTTTSVPITTNSQGGACKATNPYLASMPTSTYSPYFPPGHLMPTLLGPADPSAVSQVGPVVQQTLVPATQQKIPRSDRLEVCREFMRGACKRAESECRFAHPQDSVTTHEDGSVTVCMDAVKGRCAREPCRYFHPPLHLQAQIKAAQSRATAMDMKTMGSFYYENFLLDTLPVCQDFNRSMCTRPTCRFVHLMECDKVEVCDQRVAVCRDHAKGMCKRKQCKYYHIPIVLPPANVMAATAKIAE